MKLPKVLDRIRSIYRLTARKHKMDAERTVMKQKMNASINGSFYVPATPRKSRPAPKYVQYVYVYIMDVLQELDTGAQDGANEVQWELFACQNKFLVSGLTSAICKFYISFTNIKPTWTKNS